jgi:hypothetical protein
LDKPAFGAAVSLEASLQELAFMLGALTMAATDAHLAEVADPPLVRGADAA